MGTDEANPDKFTELRMGAEEFLGRQALDEPDASKLSPVEVQRLVHELSVHRIELEMQNEDLRAAAIELEKARDRYLDLYDFAPVGYLTSTPRGIVAEANLTLARWLGIGRRDLVNKPFSRFLLDADAYRLHLAGVLKTLSRQTCEVALQGRDGTTRQVQLDLHPVVDGTAAVIAIRIAVSDITERKRAEEQVRASLKEKEALLREIHHRVKNNLALICALIDLQAQFSGERLSGEILEELRSRIRSIVLAHELLYQSEDLAEVRIDEFVSRLVDLHAASFIPIGSGIKIEKQFEAITFSLETAIPVGFVATELISNCLKHAFADRSEGIVEISLRSIGDGEFELVVADNGVGIAEDLDWINPKSMGIELLSTFVEQLEGSIEIHRENGTEARVKFRQRGRR
jgi:PAS domain S-box-containing protein